MKPTTKNIYNDKNTRRRASLKEKKVITDPKGEVKEMFMKWFKKNRSLGQIMTKEDVVTNIIKKLDSKQDEALEDAMNELKKNELIEVQEDGVTIMLTKKGYDFIS